MTIWSKFNQKDLDTYKLVHAPFAKNFWAAFFKNFLSKRNFSPKNITRIKCHFLDKDKNNNNQK